MTKYPPKCPECGAGPNRYSTSAYECGSFWVGTRVGPELRQNIKCVRAQLAAANREIERLRAALQRQVANVEQWLETGVPASAEESKSIYEQMVAALKPLDAGGDA